jgi:hypothetical protein
VPVSFACLRPARYKKNTAFGKNPVFSAFKTGAIFVRLKTFLFVQNPKKQGIFSGINLVSPYYRKEARALQSDLATKGYFLWIEILFPVDLELPFYSVHLFIYMVLIKLLKFSFQVFANTPTNIFWIKVIPLLRPLPSLGNAKELKTQKLFA